MQINLGVSGNRLGFSVKAEETEDQVASLLGSRSTGKALNSLPSRNLSEFRQFQVLHFRNNSTLIIFYFTASTQEGFRSELKVS